MPTPNEGETEAEFLERCIPMVLEEGTTKDRDQAAAICHSMFDQRTLGDVDTRMATMLDLRIEDNGRRQRIVGTAVVYDQISQRMNFGREIIKPGTFTESLKSGPDVRALVNHKGDLILGRKSTGTLKITDTRTAMHVEIDPPDTTAGRDITESIRRGDAGGMSFAFRAQQPGGDEWEMRDAEPLRIVKLAKIFDVSVVTEEQAYLQTQVALRSLAAWKAGRTSVAALRRRLELGAAD